MTDNYISLYELTNRIKKIIDSEFGDFIWIIAEISELNINSRGHCYLNLIEKDKITEKIIAQSRATIWSSTFRMLKPYFESETGVEFTSGIKVLVKVNVNYHEQYGFSLNIRDIDPKYTIGDIELKRKQTIEQLIDDGVYDLNKEIEFPQIPKNIAVISSETAAGYGDFINQLNNNGYGFKFNYYLFNSLMQGEQAEESIINSLDKIYNYENFFDVVVIIRGGGAKVDLSCFDSYNLAYNIAQFPLPVISGIGHDRDQSIVDLVANVSVKTPTAAAEFLISKFVDIYNEIEDVKSDFIDIVNEKLNYNNDLVNKLSNNFVHLSKDYLYQVNKNLNKNINKYNNIFYSYFDEKNKKLDDLEREFKISVKNIIRRKQMANDNYIRSLHSSVKNILIKKNSKLKILEIKNNNSNPVNVLKKGYTLSYSGEKIIKSRKDLSKGDKLITQFFDGKVISEIKKT